MAAITLPISSDSKVQHTHTQNTHWFLVIASISHDSDNIHQNTAFLRITDNAYCVNSDPKKQLLQFHIRLHSLLKSHAASSLLLNYILPAKKTSYKTCT